MPVHDVGYRAWKGQPTHALSRWKIIAATGIRLAIKSRWVRRLLLAAWLPVLYWGIAFFVLEQGLNDGPGLMSQIDDNAGLLREGLPMLPQVDALAESLESGDNAADRNTIWNWLLMTFFRYPQGLLILMLLHKHRLTQVQYLESSQSLTGHSLVATTLSGWCVLTLRLMVQ